MAGHLEAEGIRPDLVLCSPARRTRETLELVEYALGAGLEAKVDEALYGASEPELLARLKTLPEEVGSVMLVGHNPGVEELALALASHGEGLARMSEKYPTAALATIDLPARRWDTVRRRSGELVGFVRPKDLR